MCTNQQKRTCKIGANRAFGCIRIEFKAPLVELVEGADADVDVDGLSLAVVEIWP